MSQSADKARATSVARGPFHPGWGPRNSSRDERALAWFDELVWHDHQVCSNCFSRMKVSRTFARDDWGNKGSDSWRTEEATLEHGHDPLPDPPKTTCNVCGSMGGLKQFDTLSAGDAVDRVPDLIDRLQEAGHLVDVGTVYGIVRKLKGSEDHTSDDKEIFAVAAALGVDKA